MDSKPSDITIVLHLAIIVAFHIVSLSATTLVILVLLMPNIMSRIRRCAIHKYTYVFLLFVVATLCAFLLLRIRPISRKLHVPEYTTTLHQFVLSVVTSGVLCVSVVWLYNTYVASRMSEVVHNTPTKKKKKKPLRRRKNRVDPVLPVL